MRDSSPGKLFMQGNEACARGAIEAGCRFFAGYPITPASEIGEHLFRWLPRVGGIAIQMEDELASLGAVIGASWAGAKAMTATSGPGFSLMQEFLGYAFMTETPCVVVNVQRAGPSTGQATKAAQGDVMQSRWGTHGDYYPIVLSPNSVEEMFTLTVRSFNLSEKYRTPVVLLSDETTAHMREQISVPTTVETVDRRRPRTGEDAFFGPQTVPPMPAVGDGFNVAVTGSTHNEFGVRFTSDPKVHRELVERLHQKMRDNTEELLSYEDHSVDDCEIGLVAYGCTSRAIYEASDKAVSKGIRVGYIRLKTIWPFPEKAVEQLARSAKKIIVPEMNLKQIYFEVARSANGLAEVIPVSKIGGGELVTPDELLAIILRETREQ